MTTIHLFCYLSYPRMALGSSFSLALGHSWHAPLFYLWKTTLFSGSISCSKITVYVPGARSEWDHFLQIFWPFCLLFTRNQDLQLGGLNTTGYHCFWTFSETEQEVYVVCVTHICVCIHTHMHTYRYINKHINLFRYYIYIYWLGIMSWYSYFLFQSNPTGFIFYLQLQDSFFTYNQTH